MLVRFHRYHKTEFETPFADDLAEGMRTHGDELEFVSATDWREPAELADVAAFVGVRGLTREIVDAYRAAGRRVVILDKGAIRTRNLSTHRRVYLDGGTALAYLMRVKRPADRWEALGIDLAPWRTFTKTAHIVYANNSQKVHDYWRQGDAREFAEKTVGDLVGMTSRRVVFRPKPRALDFREIDGAELSLKPDTIEDALAGAHCLVTHTSSCSVNALIAGVPVVTLAPNPATPVAGKYIEQALRPPIPEDRERLRLLCNLAYAQWTPEEFRTGEAWGFIRGEMEATLPATGEPTKPSPRGEDEEEDSE